MQLVHDRNGNNYPWIRTDGTKFMFLRIHIGSCSRKTHLYQKRQQEYCCETTETCALRNSKIYFILIFLNIHGVKNLYEGNFKCSLPLFFSHLDVTISNYFRENCYILISSSLFIRYESKLSSTYSAECKPAISGFINFIQLVTFTEGI